MNPQQQVMLNPSGRPQPVASMAPQTPAAGTAFVQGASWLNPNADRTLRAAMPTDEAARQRIEDATYARLTRLLDPQFEQQERRMQQQLANRGLAAGSEAYGFDNSIFQDSRSRAYTDAANQAVLAGSEEMARLFQQDLADRQLIDQRNQFDLNQLSQLYNQGGQFQNSLDLANTQAHASMYGADRGLDAANANASAAQAGASAQMAIARMNNELAQQQFQAGLDQQAFDNAFRDRGYLDQLDMSNRQQWFNEAGFFLNPGSSYQPNLGGIDVGGAFNNYQSGMNNQYNAGVGQANANWQAQQAQHQQYMQLIAMMGSWAGGG